MFQATPVSKPGFQVTRLKTYVPWPRLLRECVDAYEAACHWTRWGIVDVEVEEEGYLYTWWVETKGQTNGSH